MTTAGTQAPCPAHIPAEAVYDFDIFRDPALLRDPHERVLQLSREAPHAFPRPETFDIARENKTHLLFGSGLDRCVGLPLVRLELQTLYRAVLERLPVFRLDPNDPVEYRVTQNLLMTRLPLRWD